MAGLRSALVLFLMVLVVMHASAEDDYYKILGLPRSATEQQVKKKYRQMARKYHPDLNHGKGVKEKFQQINKAYEVLGDKQRRKEYDEFGHFGGMPSGGQPHGFHSAGQRHSTGNPFTGTHFDSSFHFGGPGQQFGGGSGFPFGDARQQASGGSFPSRKSRASSSSMGNGGFSFEKIFGQKLFDADAGSTSRGSAKSDASRESKVQRQRTLFDMFANSPGEAAGSSSRGSTSRPFESKSDKDRSESQHKRRRSSSGDQKSKRFNHAEAGKEFSGGFGDSGGSPQNSQRASYKQQQEGKMPSQEDIKSFGKIFGNDAASAPPKEMFESANSPDDASADQQEMFQKWFSEKFGGEGRPPPPDFSESQKKAKDGKQSSKQQKQRKSSNSDGQENRSKQKSNPKKATRKDPVDDDVTATSSITAFSAAAYNRLCLKSKRRCVVLFGSSTTLLSAKTTFRNLPKQFGSVRVAGKSSPLETVFLFVPYHEILNATSVLLRSFHVLDDHPHHVGSYGDTGGGRESSPSSKLCGPYAPLQRYGSRTATAEYCAVILSASLMRVAVFGSRATLMSGGELRTSDQRRVLRSEKDVVALMKQLSGDVSAQGSAHAWERLPAAAAPVL